MIIDIHTHFFPDAIAEKALKILSESGNIRPFGKGTRDSLEEFSILDGVDLAFNQPVATKPEQVFVINRQMAELNQSGKIVKSFGAMHPDWIRKGNYIEELEYLKNNKIKGIKLHPEYQAFYPDDPDFTQFYEDCSKLGLILLFHSGKDKGFDTLHGDTKRLAQIAKIKGIKLILAHMGGYQLWDDVMAAYQSYPNIYLDTAYTLEMDNEQMLNLIQEIGYRRILFGSDFPWAKQSDILLKIQSLQLNHDDYDNIIGKNAAELLIL